MKHYETVTIPPQPERTQTKQSHITCDLCGARGSFEVNGESDWSERSGDVSETEVRYKEGYTCESGGSGDEIVLHICPTCFTGKLVPWVRAQGGEPTYQEWDF